MHRLKKKIRSVISFHLLSWLMSTVPWPNCKKLYTRDSTLHQKALVSKIAFSEKPVLPHLSYVIRSAIKVKQTSLYLHSLVETDINKYYWIQKWANKCTIKHCPTPRQQSIGNIRKKINQPDWKSLAVALTLVWLGIHCTCFFIAKRKQNSCLPQRIVLKHWDPNWNVYAVLYLFTPKLRGGRISRQEGLSGV